MDCGMASVSPEIRKGKIIGYRSSLGRGPNGKDRRKFHITNAVAWAYIESAQSDQIGTEEVLRDKAEIIFNLQKLAKVNAKLTEAVDFFLIHGARQGNPTIAEVIEEFLKSKRQVDRSTRYLDGMDEMWTRFGNYVGMLKHLGDITTDQIKKFVFGKLKGTGAVTKNNYLRALSVLFNYGIRHKYVGLNPVSEIDRPKPKRHPPEVISPEDFAILLNRCHKKQWYDRMTIFVLVAYCGVRSEEACKLRWDNIDMTNKRVMVPPEVAKSSSFRRNNIPANAMKWLDLAHDARRTGPIIGKDSKVLLRSAIRYAHIRYAQNCLRHSFCSYSIESGVSKEDVASALGHKGSLKVLYDHYRNVVDPEETKKWWAIVPVEAKDDAPETAVE
jgi:integrase